MDPKALRKAFAPSAPNITLDYFTSRHGGFSLADALPY